MPNFPDNLQAARVFPDSILGSIAKEFRKIDEKVKANHPNGAAEDIAESIKELRTKFLTQKLYESLAIYAVNIEAYRLFYEDNKQAIEAIRQKVQNKQPLSSIEAALKQEFAKKVNHAKWSSVQFHGYYHKIRKMKDNELDSELKQFLNIDREFNQALYQAISQVTGLTIKHEDYSLSLQDLIDEFNLAKNPKLKVISTAPTDSVEPQEKSQKKSNVRFVEGEVRPPTRVSHNNRNNSSRLKKTTGAIEIDPKHREALETGADLNWDNIKWSKRAKLKVHEIKLLKDKKNIAKNFRNIEQKEKQLLESFAAAQESLIKLSRDIQKLPEKERAALQSELNRLAKSIDNQLQSAFQGKTKLKNAQGEDEDVFLQLQEDTGKIKVKWKQDKEIDIDDLGTIDAYSASLNACMIDNTQKDIDKLKGKAKATKPTKNSKNATNNEPLFDMKLRANIIQAHLNYSSDNSPTVLRKPSKHFFNSPKKSDKATAPQTQSNDNQRFGIRASLYGEGITQRWEIVIPEVIELISATPTIKLQDGQAITSQALTSEIQGFHKKLLSGNVTSQDVEDMKSLFAFMEGALKQEKFSNNNAMDAKLYRCSQDIDKIERIVARENTSTNKNAPAHDKPKKRNYFHFNLHLKHKTTKTDSAPQQDESKKSVKRRKP